jgi:rhodanese-related sulfurtransferase
MVGTWIPVLLVGLAACSDAPTGDAPAAGAPGSGAATAPSSGSAAVTGRAPVARPAALQAWIDRTATEVDAPTLAPDAVAALEGERVFLDVREPTEIGVSTIPRAMTLSSEAARMEYLRKGGDHTVLVCSTVGWRAAHYVNALRGAGMQAFAIEGGLCGWAAAGGRLMDRDGRLTDRIHADAEHEDCVPEGFVAVADG